MFSFVSVHSTNVRVCAGLKSLFALILSDIKKISKCFLDIIANLIYNNITNKYKINIFVYKEAIIWQNRYWFSLEQINY